MTLSWHHGILLRRMWRVVIQSEFIVPVNTKFLWNQHKVI